MSESDGRPRLNTEWHLANPMPPQPTVEQRIAWHQAHVQNCRCRPIPPRLQQEIERRGAGNG